MNWDLVADISGFVFGCLIHLGAIMARWVRTTPPELGYRDFFKVKAHKATAHMGWLIDLMLAFLWHAGMLPAFLSFVGLHFEFLTAAPTGPRFILAAIAGWVADSAGKRAFMLWEGKWAANGNGAGNGGKG